MVILFDIFPATGHYNSSFRLASLLRDRGHLITYIGPIEFEQKVLNRGFSYRIVDPFLFITERNIIRLRGWAEFVKQSYGQFVDQRKRKGILGNIEIHEKVLASVNPELVVLDNHYSLKSILYKKGNVPIVGLQTTFPVQFDSLAPPFQSSLIPHAERPDKMLIKVAWFNRLISQYVTRVGFGLLCFGATTERICKKIALQLKLNATFDYKNCLGPILTDVPTINIAPRTLDFKRKCYAANYYFYFEPGRQHVQASSEEWKATLARIYKIPGAIKVYCSLGTMTSLNPSLALFFFNKLAKLAELDSDIHFIASVGKFVDTRKIYRPPSNFHIFNEVAQRTVLAEVDLMITHGGLNSILECITSEIPIYCFPFTKHWDQPGNAARIHFHKIGMKGSIERSSIREIRGNIRTLAEKEGRYRTNVKKFKMLLEEESENCYNQIEHLFVPK